MIPLTTVALVPLLLPSRYSRNADDTACGCPDWPALGINAPSESTCYGKNPYWEALSVPWLKYLKRACPTACKLHTRLDHPK